MEHKKLLNLAEANRENKETYIDFTVAPYALVDVLLALDNNGIKNFSITKEDGDLHIRISKSHFAKYDTRDGECYE